MKYLDFAGLQRLWAVLNAVKPNLTVSTIESGDTEDSVALAKNNEGTITQLLFQSVESGIRAHGYWKRTNKIVNEAFDKTLASKEYVDNAVSGGGGLAIFHANVGDATEDLDNAGGRNFGKIVSPDLTEDMLLEAVNAGKQIILYLDGYTGRPEPVLLTHELQGGNEHRFGGIAYAVEYPQRWLNALDVYLYQRNNANYQGFYLGIAFSQFGKVTWDDVTDKPDISAGYDDTELQGKIGDLSGLSTTAQTDLVSAVNELKFAVDGLGEPFRVKQWTSTTLDVAIPYCMEDIGNTTIPKMVFTIDDVEGADYQIVGMISYELFDAASGGNRINAWPVCQFTGNGQKELGVRWMCGGSSRKTAKRISAWVLLKHR